MNTQEFKRRLTAVATYRNAITHLIVQYRLASVEYAPHYLNA